MPIELVWMLGLPVDVAGVGLSAGIRPELTWGTEVHRLRVAAGVLVGPEIVFLPVDVGYRLSLLPDRKLHPEAGMGWEFQNFAMGEGFWTRRGAVAMELGMRGDLNQTWSVGGHLATDFALVGDPGFGMTAQLGVWYHWGQ